MVIIMIMYNHNDDSQFMSFNVSATTVYVRLKNRK